MTQYSTPYTRQQPSRSLTSHNDDSLILQQNYSSVRAAVSNFDMPQKPTSSTSAHPHQYPPPLPSRSFVPISARKNHTDYDSETPPSSVGSANSDRLRQTESRVNNVSTKNPIVENSNLLTKPIRSAPKIDNQTAKQSKPIYSRRRTPPPIPTNSQDQRTFRRDRTNDAIYINHGGEFDEVQVNDLYELQDESDMDDSGTFTAVAKPAFVSREPPILLSTQTHDNGRSKIITNGYRQKDERSVQKLSSQSKNIDMDSIGLEIPEPTKTSRKHTVSHNELIYDHRSNVQRAPFDTINYEQNQNQIDKQYEDRSTIAMYRPPPPPPLPPLSAPLSPFRRGQQQRFAEGETHVYIPERHFPSSNFLLGIGALLAVFILCMVLVLAIREDETKLRTTMQLVYSYVYLVSIIWMVWYETTNDGDNSTVIVVSFIKAISSAASTNSSKGTSTYELFTRIESTMNVYLYPCLIEYSLISLTVFFLMWKNVGKTREPSLLRFSDRHIFTVNCSRASRGLLGGGIILLVTILTLIPTYLLGEDAISVTHITELVLLFVSLFFVGISFLQTTKLYHDPHAHVDAFDRVLILITTVGDFAYSFFGLFASIFGEQSASKLPLAVEISIGLLAILQTFFQSGFILDTLHRRTRTKEEIRNKPGREAVTALLLINLSIWLHDSLSAKKVRLNPIQVQYYDAGTWAIIQAFTSPLSIFYRFHSSVCLADIWQEVYLDNDRTKSIGALGNPSSRHMSDNHETEH
ncbi:unnamed protein product [Rotaria socialis]|uniref:Otopetrin n=1 Tax=Rotaria socialis TaxID=392032 RepID=A0A820UYD6_9BILA|nr:unnamed protein product [Rotaria socialis]